MSHTDAIRHRLIPTVGTRHRSWFVFGLDAAMASAHAFHTEEKVPVLVSENPEGGHQRTVTVVGGKKQRRR